MYIWEALLQNMETVTLLFVKVVYLNTQSFEIIRSLFFFSYTSITINTRLCAGHIYHTCFYQLSRLMLINSQLKYAVIPFNIYMKLHFNVVQFFSFFNFKNNMWLYNMGEIWQAEKLESMTLSLDFTVHTAYCCSAPKMQR